MAMSKQELAEELVRSAGIGDHPAPDNDPYGWIADVESGRPTIENSLGEQVPVVENYAVVWSHTLSGPEKFSDASAKVLPNGTLLVFPAGSDCPVRGYAPGTWTTFEHVGPRYHLKPKPVMPQTGAVSRPLAREAVENFQAEYPHLAQVLTDPMRRTPPTLEADADDTQNIPRVESETTEAGGGVDSPKAAGARADAGRTGRTPRPGTADPDASGRRSFWQTLRLSLMNNPDADD
jgi:hypothetical protein